MTTNAPVSHRLTEKNFVDMTATCSVDGPVKMRTRGVGRPACAVRLAQRHAAWVARNPDKARRNRRGRSAHHLSSFDESTMTGECPVCGTVGVVAKGRGFMCRTRAEELWTNQQEIPQQRCSECRKNFLRADGTCPSCTDREKLDWAYALRVGHDKAETRDDVKQWHGGGLDLVIDPERYDIASTLGDRPENPALKVLGDGVPRGQSREAFIRKWWAENGHLVEGV